MGYKKNCSLRYPYKIDTNHRESTILNMVVVHWMSQEARELAEIRYRQGLVAYLDVLDAQRIVLSAELKIRSDSTC